MARSSLSATALPTRSSSGSRDLNAPATRLVAVAALSLAALGVIAAAVVLLTLAGSHTGQANSDGASLVLEGRTMASGNVLLHGWALSLDSFWTSEVPLYALFVYAAGVHPIFLYLVPAVFAGLILLVALFMTLDGASPLGGMVGWGAALMVIGFPVYGFLLFYVRGGLHMGAVLLSLIAFAGLRKGRFGAGAALSIAALSLGMLGDLQTLAYGTVPVLIAGVVAALRCRALRAGVTNFVVAVASGLIFVAVHFGAKAIGTFSIGRANPLAHLRQVPSNLHLAARLLAALLGADPRTFGPGGMPTWVADLHIAAAVLVVLATLLVLLRLLTGVVAGTQRPPRAHWHGARWWESSESTWRVDDLLLIGAVGVVASFFGLAFFTTTSFARYLTGAVVFLGVLTGRVVARAWSARGARSVKLPLGLAGLALLALFAFGVAEVATPSRSTSPAQAGLVSWLSQHGLRSGVGAYWSSSINTVQSRASVTIRPVIENPSGRLVRYARESDAAWYSGREFRFLVYQPGAPWGGVDEQSASATWGKPRTTYHVDGYDIVVWSHAFTVSPRAGYGS